ncbi:hypothetical protein FI667_g7733, partial [Globisporangium splendens]
MDGVRYFLILQLKASTTAILKDMRAFETKRAPLCTTRWVPHRNDESSDRRLSPHAKPHGIQPFCDSKQIAKSSSLSCFERVIWSARADECNSSANISGHFRLENRANADETPPVYHYGVVPLAPPFPFPIVRRREKTRMDECCKECCVACVQGICIAACATVGSLCCDIVCRPVCGRCCNSWFDKCESCCGCAKPKSYSYDDAAETPMGEVAYAPAVAVVPVEIQPPNAAPPGGYYPQDPSYKAPPSNEEMHRHV